MDSADLLVEQGLLLSGMFPVPKDSITIVSHGVIFQQYCYNGVPYDVTVSWLQKAIRRGLADQAAYCAYEIFRLGKSFRSHLLNRLAIISSEDIGPGQPIIIRRIAKMYESCKARNNNGELQGQEVLDIIQLLASAPKSRIVDLLIHLADQPSSDPLRMEVAKAVELTRTHPNAPTPPGDAPPDALDAPDAHIVHYEYDGVEVMHRKKAPIYGMWQELLDRSDGQYYHDIVALLRLYMNTKNLVHISHAICLLHLKPRIKLQSSNQAQFTWQDVQHFRFPVMDCAIDMHTRWGRKYLGRGPEHFFLHGTELANWRPQPGEQEMQTQSRALLVGQLVTTPPVVLRHYQSSIVQKCLQYYMNAREGWLVMACGTGKTRTAFWIHQKLAPNLTIVILPYLEILQQFRSVWHDMSCQISSDSYHCGVMASLSHPIKMSAKISYTYIRKIGDWQTFAAVKRKKILYTTYASLPTLLAWKPTPDFVVCDEAHHKPNLPFECRVLKLSATPPEHVPAAQIMGFYHLNDAIKDGFLTDYRIHLLDPLEDPADHLDQVFSRGSKVIVYASKVATAKLLYQIAECSVFKCFLMESSTPKVKRDEIYAAFTERDTKCAIFNCAILGEGVDLPSCDAIYIHSGYNSPHRIVQAFGRPLRLHSDKDLSHIFIVGDKKGMNKLTAMSVYDSDVHNKVVDPA